MTEQEYRAIPALSFSSMKDLEVSPFHFWYWHINPDRPERPESEQQVFGSALHCAVLQPPEVFDAQYAVALTPPENALDTIGDMREWIKSKGFTPKGTKKDEMAAQVLAIDPDQPIVSVLEARHFAQNAGKKIISLDDWRRLEGCTRALLQEPEVSKILAVGSPEVPIFVQDPETGVDLKCRIDWYAPDLSLDLKTFSQKARKSIDESVADAIWYEGYLKQAFFYTRLRHLKGNQDGSELTARPFVIPFVESDPPHEVRIKKFQMGEDLYWTQTSLQVRRLINLYAHCMETYGTEPWRDAQEVHPLRDENFRQLGWT